MEETPESSCRWHFTHLNSFFSTFPVSVYLPPSAVSFSSSLPETPFLPTGPKPSFLTHIPNPHSYPFSCQKMFSNNPKPCKHLHDTPCGSLCSRHQQPYCAFVSTRGPRSPVWGRWHVPAPCSPVLAHRGCLPSPPWHAPCWGWQGVTRSSLLTDLSQPGETLQ